MVELVVNRGVIPAAPIAIFGVTVPLQRIAAAPPPLLPVEKCVTVEPDAPLDGKSMFACGLMLPVVDVVQPLPDRATFTRA